MENRYNPLNFLRYSEWVSFGNNINEQQSNNLTKKAVNYLHIERFIKYLKSFSLILENK
jgi:hypothetical protein